ncbi:DUF1758 domain-containing protein [Trichonephila clavipes]|nr:DUF1758 domain-containing protein [Trichonephila clavipes]
MALKLNLKKVKLISVAVEMGLVIPSKAKIIDLKKLIESSAVYKNYIEFVRSLVENALEKKKAFQIKSVPDELKAEILLNILGERVNNLLTYVDVRCLLDVGSQSCLCTRACAEKLQLKMEKINTVVSCVNDASMVVKNCLKTSVANKAKTFDSELMLLVVNKITDLIPNKVIDVDVNVSEFVPLADDKFNIPDRIDMLLGAEIFYELLKPGRF